MCPQGHCINNTFLLSTLMTSYDSLWHYSNMKSTKTAPILSTLYCKTKLYSSNNVWSLVAKSSPYSTVFSPEMSLKIFYIVS